MICATPTGSTAYNLSNGGPVLVRGLDAMAVTFIAPHSLHARPLVVPRGLEVDGPERDGRRAGGVLVDGHRVGELAPGGEVAVCLCDQRACSRRCPRRPSSAATARRSRPERTMVGVGRRLYDSSVLRRLRIENLVLIREAELELAPGLNAITGETGAGKTILAQAVGLLLGEKGDESFVGPAGTDAYVEAELDLPDELGRAAPSCGQRTRTRCSSRGASSADGRTRAYAWGRTAAREDVAAAVERVIAMSGQFEQRRLARPSYQLEVLDGFCGEDQLRRRGDARAAWRELAAARRLHDELTSNAALAEARLDELRALVEDTEGLEPGDEERLRGERERLRHVAELAEAAAAAADALTPEDGDGAAGLVALAERAVAPLERLAPELQRAGDELRDVELRLRETASELHAFLASLEAEPGRLEELEASLDRIADAKRRFRCQTYEELLGARGRGARGARGARGRRGSCDGRGGGARRRRVARASARRRAAAPSGTQRRPRSPMRSPRSCTTSAWAKASSVCDCGERELGATGADDAVFLVRPNAGMPFAPVAETASGGELSRIALAIAAVAGGETLVFDEIDAGIGGETANAVGRVLRRLAERAQVITITHLPQIAALADRHFVVEKVPGDPTHTRIGQLADEERKAELERMLGGQEFLATVRG